MLASSVTLTPVEWVSQSNITSHHGWAGGLLSRRPGSHGEVAQGEGRRHDWRQALDGSTWWLSLFSTGIRQGIERVEGGPPGDHTSRAALVFTKSSAGQVSESYPQNR